MRFTKFAVLCACAPIVATAVVSTSAFGAAETALHKVNTSVGVKPTSVTNKFKLETDPAVVTPDPTVSQYIPVEGQLNNHYDTTQFNLSTNISSGTFTLGDSVAGEGAYQVLGFKVQTIFGGLIDVADNGLGGDTYSTETQGTAPNGDPLGPVGGGYTGNVFDIHFKIITDRANLALPADQDQNFYQLFLDLIGTNPPGADTTFATSDSYLTVAPSDPNSGLLAYTIPGSDINDSSTVPEVSTSAILAICAGALLIRRRPLTPALVKA